LLVAAVAVDLVLHQGPAAVVVLEDIRQEVFHYQDRLLHQ